MNYILNKSQIESLNQIIEDKNSLSVFNNFSKSALSDEDNSYLKEQGIINAEGQIEDNETFNILANPSTTTRFMLTGGASKYEYTISRSDTRRMQVALTAATDYYTIDNKTKIEDILETIGNFTGRSNLKSITLKQKLSSEEAIVLAAIIDLERSTILRTFVDKIPYTGNKYGVNMTSRMVHSSNKSIQWFVYCISEVIGEQIALELDEVKETLDSLANKGILLEQYGQYQLTDEYNKLANRMLIIDNVMAAETITNKPNKRQESAGYTCIQSGVHDIILIDYNGSEVIFETVSSERLLEYLDKFLKMEVI